MLSSSPYSIAALDSDDSLYHGLLHRLEQERHLVSGFSDIAELLDALAQGERFDLLMLPPRRERAEWERLAAACKVLCMPMLVVAAPGHVGMIALMDEVVGDKVVTDMATTDSADAEVAWRIRTLLQRARALERGTLGQQDFVMGDYRFLGRQRLVLHRGQPIHLQERQFELAQVLFRHAGRVVTRGWLWSTIWGVPSRQEGTRSLDTCVTNVRRKLNLCSENGFTLRSIYRQGYMLCPTGVPSLAFDPSMPPRSEDAARFYSPSS